MDGNSSGNHPLNKFFPGLTGIPNISSSTQPANAQAAAEPNDPGGPPKLTAAQLHFQKLLSGSTNKQEPKKEPRNIAAIAQTAPAQQSSATTPSLPDATSLGSLSLPPPPKIPKLPAEADFSTVENNSKTVLKDARPAVATMLPEDKNLTYVVKADIENEPETTPITLYKSDPKVTNSSFSGLRVGGNSEYICYIMKHSQIRVIHKPSVQRALLRGHTKPVTDVLFCPIINSLLGTIAQDGFAIIWELKLDESVSSGSKLLFRETLRLRCDQSQVSYFSRLKWHPQHERLFVLVHDDTVSFVELSSALWELQKHNGESGTLIEEARSCIAQSPGEPITSLDFNADGSKMVTGSGMKVKVWDTSLENIGSKPSLGLIHSFIAHESGVVSNVFFWPGCHSFFS